MQPDHDVGKRATPTDTRPRNGGTIVRKEPATEKAEDGGPGLCYPPSTHVDRPDDPGARLPNQPNLGGDVRSLPGSHRSKPAQRPARRAAVHLAVSRRDRAQRQADLAQGSRQHQRHGLSGHQAPARPAHRHHGPPGVPDRAHRRAHPPRRGGEGRQRGEPIGLRPRHRDRGGRGRHGATPARGPARPRVPSFGSSSRTSRLIARRGRTATGSSTST